MLTSIWDTFYTTERPQDADGYVYSALIIFCEGPSLSCPKQDYSGTDNSQLNTYVDDICVC